MQSYSRKDPVRTRRCSRKSKDEEKSRHLTISISNTLNRNSYVRTDKNNNQHFPLYLRSHSHIRMTQREYLHFCFLVKDSELNKYIMKYLRDFNVVCCLQDKRHILFMLSP